MGSNLTDEQVLNLIAWAMEPTDEEITQFIKEFDEGKHPLSDADKDALATNGFRRSLKLSNQLSELTDLLDMAHDEFQRIHSVSWNDNPPSLGEIRSLCERGQAKIRQRVPVIEQRDKALSDLSAAQKRIDSVIASATDIGDTAQAQIQAEKLGGNIVKENFWRGELSACRQILALFPIPPTPP